MKLDSMDENLARYIFLKTGGLNPDFQKEQKEMEKEATNGLLKILDVPGDIARAGVQTAGTLKDFLFHSVPVLGLGAGASTGALWYLLNRNLQKEEMKQKRSLVAINRAISKAKGLA